MQGFDCPACQLLSDPGQVTQSAVFQLIFKVETVVRTNGLDPEAVHSTGLAPNGALHRYFMNITTRAPTVCWC